MRPRTLTVLALFLTSCGPIRSAQVEDQINGMVGLSEEHVLSCMGPPSSKSQVAATEVWSYATFGAVTSTAVVSGGQSFAVGSLTTNQDYCVVNLTLRDGAVVAANYRSHGKAAKPEPTVLLRAARLCARPGRCESLVKRHQGGNRLLQAAVPRSATQLPSRRRQLGRTANAEDAKY